MKSTTAFSIKKPIVSFAFFLCLVTGFSQSCPLSAGEYKLSTHPSSEANKIINRESGGVNYSRLWCPYTAEGQPQVSVMVHWITGFSNTSNRDIFKICIPDFSSTDMIRLENKQAYAAFGGFSEDRKKLMKLVGEKILQEVSPFAVPCPLSAISNPGNNINQDNENACRKNFARLSELYEKRSGINQHLAILQDNSYNETESRDKLSMYNKFIVLLNDTSYRAYRILNNTLGEPYNLYYNNEIRSSLAVSYGLDPKASALEVARIIRDVTAARIEYFKEAPVIIQRQKKELAATEAEIERIHNENTRRQCPGNYDINSCDLSGEWNFTRWDIDPDNGTFNEVWLFTPITKGRYRVVNQKSGHAAEAEIFGHRVKFTVNIRPDYSIVYQFLLNDVCDAGGGNINFMVANQRLEVKRSEQVRRSFIQDNLYDLVFRNKNYQGLYQRSSDNGVPIDVFFFSVNYANGYQVEQDGQKLWGRFVRKPANDYTDQSSVDWWFVNWIYESGRWESRAEKILTAPKIR